MTADGFAAVANVSRETLTRLETYLEILTRWQAALNLVGRRSLDDAWRRHFWDSAQLHRHIPPGATVIDLGSGAGFPGLVLAILGGLRLHLVESDQRKAAFLREAARQTDTEIVLHVGRAEALEPVEGDVVTARALAPIDVLIGLALPWLRDGGFCLFPKGRQAEDEIAAAKGHWNFSVSRIASRSETDATILRLGDIAHV